MEDNRTVESNQMFVEEHWLGRITDFFYPHRITFGANAVSKVGEIAKEIARNKKCIIITDTSIKKIGLIEVPKKCLEDAGFTVDIHETAGKEPVLEEVKEIINIVRKKDYGIVVGIGGGSAMDKAKFAAMLAETPGDLEEYLLPSTKPLVGSKPKLMISTTSGTGSETSMGAIISVPDEKIGVMKTGIVAPLALADATIIDPCLTVGLPPRVTAGTGMDAMCHAAEGVLSLQAHPFSDSLALKAVELVSQNLRTAWHQGDNLEARGKMALAASIGGLVCTSPCGCIIDHMASEGLSAKYGIPHGEACAVLLPYSYWYNLSDDYAQEKLTIIAKAMGVDVAGLDKKEAAKKAVTATFDLLEDINLPTSLKEYSIPSQDIPAIAEYILWRGEEMYEISKFNPIKLTLENVTAFFYKAFEGREAVGF